MPRSDSFFADLQQRWSRMPRSNRVWLICLMASAFAIAACSLSYQQQPRYEMLLAGQSFTGRELIAIEGAFAKAGLADYEIVTGRVQIPRERRSGYVAALMDAQVLPAARPVQPLASASPFESSGQRAAREKAVVERELSESVRRFHDIEDASVRMDEAVTGQGFQRTRRMTSMVVVQAANGPLSAERIRSICRLVASAKVELNEEDVTVTDLTSGRCYGGAALAQVDYQQTDDFALRKQDSERKWAKKIQDALHFVPGVQVATSVDLQSSSDSHDGLVTKAVAVSVSVPDSYYQQIWDEHRHLANGQLDKNAEETTVAAIEHETRERILQTIRPLLPNSVANADVAAAQISVTSFPDVGKVVGVHDPLVVGGIADWFRSNVAWALFALLAATLLGFYALRGLGSDLRGLWRTQDSGRQLNHHQPNHRQPDHQTSRSVSAVEPSSLRVVTEPESDVAASENDVAEVVAYTPSGVRSDERKREQDSLATRIDGDADSDRESQAERELIESSTRSTDEIFADGESPVHGELTQIVRENPDAAAELLKQWIDKAG